MIRKLIAAGAAYAALLYVLPLLGVASGFMPIIGFIAAPIFVLVAIE